MTTVALALAWPWVVLKVLGLGLMTYGLINITANNYHVSDYLYRTEMLGLGVYYLLTWEFT